MTKVADVVLSPPSMDGGVVSKFGRGPRELSGALAAVSCSLALLQVAPAQARPLRVMSINLCGDQLVLALLPRAQITSVTWLARDPSESVMAQAAARVPINHGSAEEVLRDRPDLVIAGAYAAAETQGLLKKLHYPLLELTGAESFEDIRRETRQVAAAVGAKDQGEALIARMDATLRQLSRTSAPPLRVAAWDGAGFSARPGTLYDAVLRAAGARNVANEAAALKGAPDVETLLAIAPDLLVEGEPGFERPGRRTDVLDNPTIRRFWGRRTVVVPQSSYLCGTPFSADAAVRLRRELQAARMRAETPLPFVTGGRR